MRIFLALVGTLAIGACGPTRTQTEQINATQAVIAQKVQAGQMTPEEGRLVVATLKADMENARRRNGAVPTGEGVAVYQPVGGGTTIRY